MSDPAAAALRNAALLIEAAGHTTGTFVDKQTGALCIDGALKLATTAKLARMDYGLDYQMHYTGGEKALYAAQDALMAVLPDKCEGEGDHDTTNCQAHPNGMITGESKIHHYNDFVCEGGQQAIDLLLTAADMREVELLAQAELTTQDHS